MGLRGIYRKKENGRRETEREKEQRRVDRKKERGGQREIDR